MPDRTTQLILLLLTSSLVHAQEVQDVPVPTWHGGMQALFEEHCASCHLPGGVAPFPLVSHQDVLRRRTFIAQVTRDGIMPPWLPDEGVAFRHARGLDDEEIKLIGAWVEAGAPLGKLPEAIPPAESSVTPPVRPDPTARIATMRAPWEVPAQGGRRWFKAERDKRTFILPLENDQPLRIQGITYRSASPIVLAATALSADDTGEARRVIDWDDEPGSYMMGDFGFTAAGSLVVVGPGGGEVAMPEGYHLQIPAHSDIVSEVHFRPQGRSWRLDDRVHLEPPPQLRRHAKGPHRAGSRAAPV